MKAALSLMLIVCLVGTTLPVTAQERVDRTAGPISRAMSLEAVRLATQPAAVDAGQQPGTSPKTDWSRVRTLAPGTTLTVTVQGSQPSTRHFLLADQSELTLLNLTDPTLPASAIRVLVDTASHHPEYFGAAQAGDSFVLDKNMRMGPDGVVVGDRKVADLGAVVERVMRSEVREVSSRGRTGGSVVGATVGAAGGLLLGGLLALNLAYKQCGGSCNDEKALIGLSLIGLPIASGVLGHRAFGRKTTDVIYKVP
jgi:hypothetical protein